MIFENVLSIYSSHKCRSRTCTHQHTHVPHVHVMITLLYRASRWCAPQSRSVGTMTRRPVWQHSALLNASMTWSTWTSCQPAPTRRRRSLNRSLRRWTRSRAEQQQKKKLLPPPGGWRNYSEVLEENHAATTSVDLQTGINIHFLTLMNFPGLIKHWLHFTHIYTFQTKICIFRISVGSVQRKLRDWLYLEKGEFKIIRNILTLKSALNFIPHCNFIPSMRYLDWMTEFVLQVYLFVHETNIWDRK